MALPPVRPFLPVLPVYLVHWNAVDWCTSAVTSLLGSRGVELDLVVVDNGASGGRALRAALPDRVRVLTLGENRGYAGGANAALADWAHRHPEAPFAVVGSHDLHADPDALARLVQAANDDPAIGVAGPAVLGPTTSYGGRWDGGRGRLVKAAPTGEVVERDWVSGTCMLLRRACCDAVGKFDATFGSYAEDVDFGLRARDRGWRVVVVPSARTWGLGTRDRRAVRIATRNDILLAAKRGGARGYAGAVARSSLHALRGHAGALRPRVDGSQRAASWRLANDRLIGVLRVLGPARVARALRTGRVDARRDSTDGLHVLFLSHEAHRSGAPVVLLTLLRWLVDHTATRCTVVVAEDGPLVDEFAHAATVHCLPGATPGLGRLVRRLGLPSWFDAPRWVRAHWLRRRIGVADVVYANAMTSATALGLLGYSEPVVGHVHELPGAIRRRVPPRDLAAMLARTDRFIAVSDAVAEGLVAELGVDANRVQVVHGFLDGRLLDRRILDPARRAGARSRARDAFGLDDAAFVVGGAGRADWAKGADRFVEVASRVRHGGGPDHHRFLWIGPVKAGDDERMRTDEVSFVGERVDAPECFAAFDVLALTSREDSFPLVVLECAALGIPTVCFADGGGAPEFVGNGGGVVVPPSDLEAFARAIAQLAADPEARTRLGQRAHDLASTKHAVDELAPQILEAVERTRRPGRGRRVG